MDRPVLACDIDSTIYGAENLYEFACKKIFKKSFYQDSYYEDGTQNWYHEKDLVRLFGEHYSKIFVEALHPRHFHKRVLYDGVQEVLEEVQLAGISVHFVTHNPSPSVREPLHRWLKKCFGEDVGLSITTKGKKGPILSRICASCFVDDSPPNMEVALGLGIPTLAKRHPWNKEFLEEHPEVVGFDEWDEIRPILLENLSGVVAA